MFEAYKKQLERVITNAAWAETTEDGTFYYDKRGVVVAVKGKNGSCGFVDETDGYWTEWVEQKKEA